VLGFADETWWSRFALPHLHTWTDPDEGPLRLIEQEEPKHDPDPKALACYGVLLRQVGRIRSGSRSTSGCASSTAVR